jgi:hypothetical protein
MELQIGQGQAITVVYGEQRFPLRRPKIKEARSLNADLELAEKKQKDYFDVVGKFLECLGLPVGVFEDLDVSQVEQIVKAVSTAEQKKS